MNRFAAPSLRLVGSILLFLLLTAASQLVPINMRPEPVQHVTLPKGVEHKEDVALHILAPAHMEAYIPDLEASCPAYMLFGIVFVMWILTAATSPSIPAALDAAATYAVGQALNGILTGGIKEYCGYFRPNYFAGCGWNATAMSCAIDFKEGRHSFPSGHSSSSACGAIVLTLFLLRACERLEGDEGKAGMMRWLLRYGLSIVVPVPMAVAGWIAASRVHDNWHFPADVAAGSALGAACGALAVALVAGRPSEGGGDAGRLARADSAHLSHATAAAVVEGMDQADTERL